MKHTIVLFTLVFTILCGASVSFAADVIAVLDFKSIMADDELGIAVAEILRTELASLGDYTIIERGVLEQILEEQALQSSGAIDSGTAAEIGKLLGAKLVVSGSIVKTGDVYTINSRFIDVETGVIKTGQNIRGEGDNEISNMVHQLALVITGRTIVSEEALATSTPEETAAEPTDSTDTATQPQTDQPQPQANTQPAAAPQHLMLFSFENNDVGNVWEKSSKNIKVSRSQEYPAEGAYSAQVVFPKSREAQAVVTNQVLADWSAYAVLEFHVYWDSKASEQSAMLGIAVEDAQSAQEQGFTKEFRVHPGNNIIWFGLDDIGQEIDLTSVARLGVSSRNTNIPLVLYIDAIQLSTAAPQQSQSSAQPTQQQPEGGFPAPPPEALTACQDKQQGDACEFMAPHGLVSGKCQQLSNQQLGCGPAGGSPRGNPPQGDSGRQPRPPKR